MNLKEEELPEFIKEIRNLVGNIKGVKGRVSETFSLSYVAVVDEEEEKKAVEEIANVLTQQAAQYAIDLEIVPATESELKQAREELLAAQMKSKGSFEV
jgi:DNA-directed RNA polymerase subunit F